MTIDVYTAQGTKKGTVTLPKDLFEVPINEGLMHQAVIRQQSNRRAPVAHVKTRGEVKGSTRKLYAQKGTGRARRGSVRSPLLRGGGKAFGPRSSANFFKDMPQTMRRKALFSSLSLQAKEKNIIGLESYPDTIRTKDFVRLLEKLPVDIGRNILVVTASRHEGLALSARNVPKVKTVLAAYLNPEDVLRARHIVFLVDAIKKVEEVFAERQPKQPKQPKKPKKPKKPRNPKKGNPRRRSNRLPSRSPLRWTKVGPRVRMRLAQAAVPISLLMRNLRKTTDLLRWEAVLMWQFQTSPMKLLKTVQVPLQLHSRRNQMSPMHLKLLMHQTKKIQKMCCRKGINPLKSKRKNLRRNH